MNALISGAGVRSTNEVVIAIGNSSAAVGDWSMNALIGGAGI
jgi:hypothetical protein